jgi:hypothetical protein
LILCIFCISQLCIAWFPAQIDDGDEEDYWHVMDHTTKTFVPPRVDCYFQQSDDILTGGDFVGMSTNIWNSAKIHRFLVQSLSGGGSNNMGYHALRWETIVHGNAGKFMAICTQQISADRLPGHCLHPAIRNL